MNFNKYKYKKKELDINVLNINLYKLNKFIFKIKKSLGKNNGEIVLRHRGGGAKKKFRLINWKENKLPYRVLKTEYDPYRSSFLNLIQYKNGSLCYKLSHTTSKINTFINFESSKLFEGNLLSLHHIPSKNYIHSLEKIPDGGAMIARSAGSFCKIFKKTDTYAEIILPSKKKKKFSLNCKAAIGINSNSYHKFNKKYKAGNNRHLNKRPFVRGVAMNPVDHPHGGGEGKTSGGRPSVSIWGKLTKNVPTVKKK